MLGLPDLFTIRLTLKLESLSLSPVVVHPGEQFNVLINTYYYDY